MQARRDDRTSGGFVGRTGVLRELAAGLDEAEVGRGGLVLVTGEPGIGKTRLCVQFEAHAQSRGAGVVWGRCWDGEGAPAYWPWVQILRGLTGHNGDQAPLTVDQSPLTVDALPPTVANLLAGGPPSAEPDLDPERARFRFFDDLTQALTRAAVRRPLVVVLDDLQWADTPSLLALRFLAGELTGSRLVVLGTYRDVEVSAEHPLGQTLARLGGLARHVPLLGMDGEEIGALITLVTGAGPHPDLVRSVLRRTGGNPFFVGELLRLVSTNDELRTLTAENAVPRGVREVVQRRLSQLPEQTVRVLEAAAVLGQDFDVDVTAHTADVPWPEAVAALETAETVRLVARAGGVARYEFSHALVREVLYAGIGGRYRPGLHLRAGQSLERRHAADPARHVAEIAVHLALAAPSGDPAKAVAYSLDAGRRSMSLLAWEEAAAHFERALQVLDAATGTTSAAARCDLLLDLGEARVRAGETDGARASFLAAAALARDEDDAVRLARAALGLGSASAVWGVDPVLTELLQTAGEWLDGREPGLVAQLLARLAQAQYFSASDAEREEMSRRAVEMARVSGEDRPLAAALVARRVLWGPEDLAGRAALAEELLELARRTHNPDLEAHARAWRVTDLVEQCDLAAADRERVAHAALARSLRQPMHLRDAAIWRSMRALLDGRFADAKASAEEALHLGEHAQDPGARPMYGVQLAMIAAEQADSASLQEAIPLVAEVAGDHPEIPAWRALLAFCEARAGRADEARLDLEQVAAAGFTSVRRDATYLVALAHAADAAAILGLESVAAALLPLLSPFSERAVVIDRGLACKGVTTRLLGLLEGARGDHHRAVALLDRSLSAHERMGARAFAARNRAELAAALLRRDGPDDAQRVASLLEEAERAARTLGMPGLLEEIDALRSTGRPARPLSGRPARPDSEEQAGLNVFRREGEWWTLAFGGRVIRMRDAKGLADIARLVAAREREIHVLDLLGPPEPASRASASSPEVLDSDARRAYEARIIDLQEEIAEAESRHDVERAAQAREESEFLVRELSAALGLGGRARRVSDEAERARKAVAWRIRDVLRRIDREHPELARHLRASLRTGVFCSYRPEHAVDWQL